MAAHRCKRIACGTAPLFWREEALVRPFPGKILQLMCSRGSWSECMGLLWTCQAGCECDGSSNGIDLGTQWPQWTCSVSLYVTCKRLRLGEDKTLHNFRFQVLYYDRSGRTIKAHAPF
jgi:hypothetical protein